MVSSAVQTIWKVKDSLAVWVYSLNILKNIYTKFFIFLVLILKSIGANFGAKFGAGFGASFENHWR